MILKVTDLLSEEVSELEIDVSNFPESLVDQLQKRDLYIAPGLIDLQINGYAGIDFNSEDLTLQAIEHATEEILKDGVSGYLPTLITGDPKVLEQNLVLFTKAIRKDTLSGECIKGIHLEGPFISPADGARGAHPIKWIREPDFRLIKHWQEISRGNIKLVTMSPEYEGSLEFIEYCTNIGIRVAIGHTDATVEQIRDAVKAGASLSTHLGNAIPRMIHRHSNLLFEQMANDKLYASIIADGHHLTDQLFRIMERSKPGHLFLVSDSTMFAGMEPGIYKSVIGGEVELAENKRLSMLGNPEYLAGSASSLLDCINYLGSNKLLTFAQAWKMASEIPARFLNMDKKNPLAQKDLNVLCYEDEKLTVLLRRKGFMYIP